MLEELCRNCFYNACYELKVLTKTMHEQGSNIYSIAKVQYAVCMQAGIFIPDEFLTDVLVAQEIMDGD